MPIYKCDASFDAEDASSASSISRAEAHEVADKGCGGHGHSRVARRGARQYGRAKRLNEAQVQALMNFVCRDSSVPIADLCKFLFSFHAGLRAGEISGLTLYDVTDAQGNVADEITVPAHISKTGRSRSIPMSAELREAIQLFRETYPGRDRFAISKMKSLVREQTPNAVSQYMSRMYKKAGFEGCSSHSGRRTFATGLGRRHQQAGMSLRDVQLVLGHARLDTTEAYLDPSESQKPLIDIAAQMFDARSVLETLK